MIISVSRRTDIPNYYSEWFYNRINERYLYVRNPMNTHQISRIDLSPDVVDCIVFWTKNPENMMGRLDEIKQYSYYFQFTLTGYGKDIEPGLPDKKKVLIPVFQNLSKRIGKERVIWRYDPILINDKYSYEYHFRAFEEIAKNLSGYTEKVIISFIDMYAKIQRNTKKLGIIQNTKEEMKAIGGKLANIAYKYGILIESCAEQIDLMDVGISHGCCIDKKLIERIINCRLNGSKDKNQRSECGCLESIDIGTYNTCANGCKYCYANYNYERVKQGIRQYDPYSPLLCSCIEPEDEIIVRKMDSLRDKQMRLWDF